MKCNKKKLNEIAVLLCYTKDLSRYMSCSESVDVELGMQDYYDIAIAAFAMISETLDKAHSIVSEM